ncbi:MAG: M20/M25/M40 family metallo-hydrolase [Clostridia bacterium]|nr:M20/M25/M40 family metallo-hydrolase [Clostridia bacterium]
MFGILSALTAGGIAGIAVAAAIVLFFLVLIIRTMCHRGKIEEIAKVKNDDIDKDRATKHLQEAVRIPTVSMVDEFVDNKEPFINYREWIKASYPEIVKQAELTVIKDYSLIWHIKGSNPSLKPGCFLSHIDVVPAPVKGWEHDPFSGDLTEDGYIYGRGSQDMKGHMIALLEALEYHLEHGKKFERDIYLCFGHDEEPPQSNEGASSICAYLKKKGIEMEFVVDEGGTVLDGSILGIPRTVALIGAAEKGNGDFEIVVKKAGGHASNPKPPTADGILAECIRLIEHNRSKARWTYLTKEMFKTLAPHANPLFKFFFINRDVFSPLLKFVFTVAAPMTNALIRTTYAPTVLWGSEARNTIPMEAKVNVNYRMITGETMEDAKAYLEKILHKYVKKGWVEVHPCQYSNPSVEADIHCFAYKQIDKSIQQTFDNIVVAPYPFIAASDARFYNPLTDNVFRFGPFINSLDDTSRIHGINERQHVDNLAKAVQFFITCLENTCGNGVKD